MSEYQEALNRLNQDSRYQIGNEKMIIQKLVDKDTPMKPINVQFNTHNQIMFGDCPLCKRMVVAYSGCSNNDCRQKMDWNIEFPKGETPKSKFESVSQFPPQIKEKCKTELKKLHGIAPYDGTTNFVRGDNYFASSIRKMYPAELIAECERELKI